MISMLDLILDETPTTVSIGGAEMSNRDVSPTVEVENLLGDIEDLLNSIAPPMFAQSSRSASRNADLPPGCSWNESVLNFGMPSFVGRTMDQVTKEELVHNVRNTLERFEPRLDADSLEVSVEKEQHGAKGKLMLTVRSCLRVNDDQPFICWIAMDTHYWRTEVYATNDCIR